MLRLVQVLLFGFALGKSFYGAHLAVTDWTGITVASKAADVTCDQWCSSNFPASAARRACIKNAKAAKGLCFTCGPKASSTLGKTLCGTACVDTKKDKNNCGACRKVVSGSLSREGFRGSNESFQHL